MLRELFMSLIHALFGPPPRTGRRPGTDEVVEEPLTFTARLPSSSQGLWFDAAFDLVVTWYRTGGGEHARERALLQSSLIREAARRSADFALGDHGRAQAEIACALTDGGLRTNAIHDLGVKVALTAPEEDLSLERQRQLVWHRAEVAREEHRVRMRRVQELREEVFHDPLVARVWWFEQHQERWNEIAAAGAALDLLSPGRTYGYEAGHVWPEGTTSTEEPEEDPVLDAFLSGLDGHEKASVLVRLTDILEAFERRDLVERLRDRWPST